MWIDEGMSLEHMFYCRCSSELSSITTKLHGGAFVRLARTAYSLAGDLIGTPAGRPALLE
jgi:hypothetical protein